VAQVLNELIVERGTPASIRLDDSPEFTSRVLNHWAWRNQ